MSPASRDLYSVLGVERGASADEIKAAYRSRARKLHPDVDASEGAAERFAELQRAYAVLSDDEKRRRYDRYGSVDEDVFAQTAASFDPDELGSMFDAFFGARGAPGRARSARRGRDLSRPVDVSFLTAVRGGSQSMRIDTGAGVRTIDLKVPAGVLSGAKLRVRGGGEKGVGEGASGDLIVTVRVGRHPVFRRVEGAAKDIELDLPLSVAEAVLGATVEVPTPEGRRVELRVPEGTRAGAVLRVRGHGVRPSSGEPGDLRATVVVVPPDPTELTQEERTMIEGLTAKTRGLDPRFEC